MAPLVQIPEIRFAEVRPPPKLEDGPRPVQCEARNCVGDVIYRCGLKPGHEGDHERTLVGPAGYGGTTIVWREFYSIAEGD